MLYLIGVFYEFVLCEKLEARWHVEDPVDTVDDSLVGNFRGYAFEACQEDVDLFETDTATVDPD